MIGEKIREIARLRKVAEKIEGERNESRKDVANYERQIDDARATLGARPDELLSDAAQRVRNDASRYWSWVNECALSVGESRYSNVPDRVAVLARESAQIAEARQILGAAEGESLGDAARRHARTAELVTEARKHLEPLVSDPSGDIEDLAMMVAHRFSFLLSPADTRDLRQILRARDGESLKDAARRVAANEHAEAEPPQVFRIIPRVTIDRTAVRFEVVTTDPGIRALTADQIARLGLVVCDE